MNITVYGTQKVTTDYHRIIIEGKVKVSILDAIATIQEVIEKQITENTTSRKESLEVGDRVVYGHDWHPRSGYYNKEDVRLLTEEEQRIIDSIRTIKDHFEKSQFNDHG